MKHQQNLKIILLLLSTLFYSCSSNDLTGKTPAELLYKQAKEYYDKERYLLATEKVGQIRSQYPYSFYATHAELMQADILFAQENYVEAAAMYITFRDLHPKHEKLDYVVFKIAESYFNQLPSTYDRDLSMALEAIKYYQELIEKFPNSEFQSGSQEKIATSQKMLIDKDRYIADFYFKTDAYDAAYFRYQDIVSKYNDSDLLVHAKKRIVESSFYANKFDECVNHSRQFQSEASDALKTDLKKLETECLAMLEEQKVN